MEDPRCIHEVERDKLDRSRHYVTAMAAAAERQGIADANRISFIDAMQFLQSVIMNPPRVGRSCPPVIKRRMKSYDLMNKPRSEYAQPRAEAEVTG